MDFIEFEPHNVNNTRIKYHCASLTIIGRSGENLKEKKNADELFGCLVIVFIAMVSLN